MPFSSILRVCFLVPCGFVFLPVTFDWLRNIWSHTLLNVCSFLNVITSVIFRVPVQSGTPNALLFGYHGVPDSIYEYGCMKMIAEPSVQCEGNEIHPYSCISESGQFSEQQLNKDEIIYNDSRTMKSVTKQITPADPVFRRNSLYCLY
ncbi:uncharacterized protein LOC143256359 isoform X3 [Tachypleus tridentatus]|uniref:uncharacterized protein LOC143256359 isoform X3 n=1 Tax=Tachypleus tridentatus TaxID=6853 RepID=UPI003FD4967D